MIGEERGLMLFIIPFTKGVDVHYLTIKYNFLCIMIHTQTL